MFLKEIKNVSVGNLIITGSIFNNYCKCGCKKYTKKPADELKTNNETNDENKDKDPNNNPLPDNKEKEKDKKKDKEENENPLSKEDLEKQTEENNKANDELGKIKEEIDKKIENLKILTEIDILTKFNSIENKDFFEKCKKLLDIIKNSDYLNNKKPDCFSSFKSEYDCLIETHKKLSTDQNYYNKYIDVLKIYAYYFYFLKDLHNLKSKIEEKVKNLEEDIKKIDDRVFNDELDNTLKQINENLSYYSFIHENSLDKIINNAQKEVKENDNKIEEIKKKLTTALSSAKTDLESKKTETESKIKTIEGKIAAINKTIENNNKIIKNNVGESTKGNDTNYQDINKNITEILKKITITNQFIYIDSYKDNTAVINKFNSLKPEIIKSFKSDIEFCENQINFHRNQIEWNKKNKISNELNYKEISEYLKKIDEDKNEINEINTNLDNKIKEEIDKKNIEEGSQVIFHIGYSGGITEHKFDKVDNNKYDLEKIPYILIELQNLFSSVNNSFLSNYYVNGCKYFKYSPEKEKNETEDKYEKRVKNIKKMVDSYFEKLKIDYKELNKNKSDFDTLIRNLKTESENALKAIENFFKKKGENEYYKEFDEKRKNYIKIIEELGTQYYALKDFYDKKFKVFKDNNAKAADEIDKANTIINDNQRILLNKKFKLAEESESLERINDSLKNLDDCLKNIIIEDKEKGTKNVNSNFSKIYRCSTGNPFKYDDDHDSIFYNYNKNSAIIKSLNANKEKIEKAVADRNEKVESAKKIRDEKNKIINEYKYVYLYNSNIEGPFGKIIKKINEDNSIDDNKIKMFFEKTILIGIKEAIDKKNSTCYSSCTSKQCYNNLRQFLKDCELEETYNSIVTEWKNAIKDSSSYPSFSKDL